MAERALPAGLDERSVFRSLFSAYPDALLLVDAAGTITLANPAASSLLGYALDELAGLSVDQLVPDGIRPRHAAYRDAYAHNPRPRPMGTQMELVAKRRDGSEVMVEIALSPLQDEGLPFVVAAIRDIGAYPRVKQALQRARYSEFVAQMGRLAVDTRDIRSRSRCPRWRRALQVEPRCSSGGQSRRLASPAAWLAAEEAPQPHCHRPDTPPGFVLAEGCPAWCPTSARSGASRCRRPTWRKDLSARWWYRCRTAAARSGR
jgi:PAS domain S-box-containing protein